MYPKLARFLVLGLLIGLTTAAADALGADDKPRNDKLPLNADWKIDLLKDLGTITSTRDETKPDNRVVWVLTTKSPTTPALAAKFFDDKNKAVATQTIVWKVLKNEENKCTIQATVNLPAADVQKNVRKVEIVKVDSKIGKD